MVVSDIVEAVNSFLNKEDFHYSYDEDDHVYNYGFKLHKSILRRIDSILVVDPDGDDCLTIGYLGIQFDKNTEKDLKLLLFGINNHMSRGLWQIEGDDVRYTRSLPVEGDATITDEMLDSFIYSVPCTIEQYADSIICVASGYSTSEEVLARLFEDEDDEEIEQDTTNIQSDVEIESDVIGDIILWMKTNKKSE